MQLSFKNWLSWNEDQTALAQPQQQVATAQQVAQIASSVWGPMATANTPDSCWTFGGGVICNSGGRNIQMRYYPPDQQYQKPRVNVIFMHDAQNKLGADQVSTAEPDVKFQAARNLQAGSLDLGRRLMTFAKKLKDAGVMLSYSTEGRREDIYSKFLSRVGMQEIAPGVWE
jgi:hypothetical protein